MKIGINGTGIMTRAIIKLIANKKEFNDLEVIQVNGRTMTIETFKDRLLYSSAQGHSNLNIEIDKDKSELIVNNRKIKYSQISNPEDIQWLPEVELLIEATGKFRDNTKEDKDPNRHFKSPNNNLKCIVISAPGKGDIKDYMWIASPNLEDDLKEYISKNQPFVLGGASCTTTATVPIVDTIDEAFGIESLYLTTVHAVTRSQEIVDGSGGWSGFDTLLHTTGATSSTNKVLKKKIPMNGISYRVPDKAGSFIQIDAVLKQEVTKEKILEAFKTSKYAPGISYSTVKKPPTSYVRGIHSMVVLIPEEIVVLGDKRVIIRGLYDNEEGYVNHFLQLIAYIISLMK